MSINGYPWVAIAKPWDAPFLASYRLPLIYQPISLRIHPRPQTFDWASRVRETVLHRFLRDIRKGLRHERGLTCKALFPCVYSWSLTYIVPSLLRPPNSQSALEKRPATPQTFSTQPTAKKKPDKTRRRKQEQRTSYRPCPC